MRSTPSPGRRAIPSRPPWRKARRRSRDRLVINPPHLIRPRNLRAHTPSRSSHHRSHPRQSGAARRSRDHHTDPPSGRRRVSPPRWAPSTRVWLKEELFQRTGSFKPRGALSVMLDLDAAALARGVTGVSAGNHAISLGYSSRRLGTTAKVVMPKTANPVPRAGVPRTRGHGRTGRQRARGLRAGEGDRGEARAGPSSILTKDPRPRSARRPSAWSSSIRCAPKGLHSTR